MFTDVQLGPFKKWNQPFFYYFIPAEKVQEVKKNFLQESGIQFSDLEEKVLQFHLSNLEYACGSTLDQVCVCFN